MMGRTFLQLNHGWNADPNAPSPRVEVSRSEVTLQFLLSPFELEAAPGELGLLSFSGCSEWRLGCPNDEGWYRGDCRYSGAAPAWGEFYEIIGADQLARLPVDWNATGSLDAGTRHFLFYLRDETFECFADEWAFSRQN